MNDDRQPLPARRVPPTVLTLDDGTRWVALATPADVHLVERMCRVTIASFAIDVAGRVADRPSWYALVRGGPEPTAVLVVAHVPSPRGSEAQDEADVEAEVFGEGQCDPYPLHGGAIAALGRHLGVDLGPDRYPCARGEVLYEESDEDDLWDREDLGYAGP